MDVRYAWRVLRKSPGFTAVAVVSLALGIGANTAIFSLVDGLWTRPMAVVKPAEIVRVFGVTSQGSDEVFSLFEYRALKQAAAFQDLIALGGRGARVVNRDGTSELHTVNVVTPNFFSVLGVRAAAGRVFSPADDATGLVVVLGNSFWKRRFGGDPEIIGKQIELLRGSQSVLFTIAGVLPESFRHVESASDRDLWLPPQSWAQLVSANDLESHRWFSVLGRIAPGVSVASANAQVVAIAQRLAAGRSARVISDFNYRVKQAGTNGLLLLSVVLLLVLLCSVNVANLLLARSASRVKEISVRVSLGAPRFRVVRQLMTENMLLGVAGLGAGLLIGFWLIRILPSLLIQPPSMFQPLQDFRLDARVLGFTLVVSACTIVLFGLAPAWRTSKTTSQRGGARRGFRLRHWLVIGQIGVSLTLLAATGVLVRSFLNTRTLDYGLSRKPLLLVWAMTPEPSLISEAMARIRSMPGVREVAIAIRAPLSLSENGISKRVSFPDLEKPVEIKYNSISSNYLPMMGTALRRGRGFDETDQTSGEPVALINETMAQRFWPHEDAIHRTMRVEGAVHRVVGVVQNAPINSIGESPEPYLYLPFRRNPSDYVTFVIQTEGDALALARPARQKLLDLSRQLDPPMITTEEELIRYSAGAYQITAELVSVLGFLGLVLTAVGLYGVVSYGVNQRTREIGIRMALGAERTDALRLVLREVAVLGAMGLVFGIPMALAATRLSASLLFGVSPWNVALFGSACVLLGVVLLFAGFVPARRATRVDPMVALRYE